MRKDYISLGEVVYSDFVISMIETDKKIYFDRRGFPKNAWMQLLKNPLVSLFYLLIILFNVYLFIYFSVPFKILVVLIYTLFLLFIIKMYASLSQITVINKSWISKRNSEGVEKTIEGKIPDEETTTPQGMSFVFFVTEESFSRLPFIDKFFSGKFPLISRLVKIQQKMSQLIGKEFILQYKEL